MPITAPATGGYLNRSRKITPNPPQGPRYPNPQQGNLPFDGTIDYRGGEKGVDSDFGLHGYAAQRNMGGYLDSFFNQQQSALAGNNNIRSQAAGMSTAGQIAKGIGTMGKGIGELQGAKGQFDQSNSFYSNLMQNGMYDRGTMDKMLANAYGQSVSQGRVLGDNINSAMSARGAAANPLAGASMRMRAAFEGAGQRGNMMAGLEREQAQSKITGAQGHSGNAQAMAGLSGQMASLYGNMGQAEMMPTQEGAMQFMQDVPQFDQGGYDALYDKWRNAAIGPGAGLQAPKNTQGGYRPGAGIAPDWLNRPRTGYLG
jgi:hypothetical protein